MKSTLVGTATLALALACTGTVKVERVETEDKPDSGAETPPDSGSPSTGGRPGQGGSGGGGSGGSASTGAVTVAEEAACAAYQRGRCEWGMRCGDGSASCDMTWDCTSELFAAGTSRTVEGVIACAAVMAKWDCADWPPPCLTPGKLPKGAPCTYGVQCASHYCGAGNDTSSLTCGACQVIGEEDGPCGENTVCPEPQQCIDGRCKGSWPTYTDLPAGDDCSHERQRDEFVRCGDGLWCEDSYADGGITSTCVDIPSLGEACSFYCEPPAVCAAGTCRSLPRLGEDCLIDDGPPARGLCEDGARCLQGKCVARGKTGDPCEPKDDEGVQCENGRCECAGSDCTRYVCSERRYAGESCADPNTVCHYGTRCQAGVCVSGALGKPHAVACD